MDENGLNTNNNSYDVNPPQPCQYGAETYGGGKKSSGRFKAAAVLAVCICICFAAGAGVGTGGVLGFNRLKEALNRTADKDRQRDTVSPQVYDEAEIEADRTAEPLAYASQVNVELIKRVKKSVVCIVTTSQGRDFLNMPYESSGAGSGIIFSEDDDNIYIVTNNHVVDGAEKIMAGFDDEKAVSAKVIGKNENSDLAVIAVSKRVIKNKGITYSTAAFGNSDEVKEGSGVIAIGNALGDGNTATMGVVSSVNKEIASEGKKLKVIQTDAAINPGNSGGALINLKGEVIGINTAKYSKTEVEGVGYSITSNSAKTVIEKIMNNETPPVLGVYVADVTEDMLDGYDIPATGVLITQIIEGSSADRAGLAEGDIVTGINSKPVFNKEQLVEAISSHKTGDEIELKILRDNKTKTVRVRLFSNEG